MSTKGRSIGFIALARDLVMTTCVLAPLASKSSLHHASHVVLKLPSGAVLPSPAILNLKTRDHQQPSVKGLETAVTIAAIVVAAVAVAVEAAVAAGEDRASNTTAAIVTELLTIHGTMTVSAIAITMVWNGAPGIATVTGTDTFAGRTGHRVGLIGGLITDQQMSEAVLRTELTDQLLGVGRVRRGLREGITRMTVVEWVLVHRSLDLGRLICRCRRNRRRALKGADRTIMVDIIDSSSNNNCPHRRILSMSSGAV